MHCEDCCCWRAAAAACCGESSNSGCGGGQPHASSSTAAKGNSCRRQQRETLSGIDACSTLLRSAERCAAAASSPRRCFCCSLPPASEDVSRCEAPEKYLKCERSLCRSVSCRERPALRYVAPPLPPCLERPPWCCCGCFCCCIFRCMLLSRRCSTGTTRNVAAPLDEYAVLLQQCFSPRAPLRLPCDLLLLLNVQSLWLLLLFFLLWLQNLLKSLLQHVMLYLLPLVLLLLVTLLLLCLVQDMSSCYSNRCRCCSTHLRCCCSSLGRCLSCRHCLCCSRWRCCEVAAAAAAAACEHSPCCTASSSPRLRESATVGSLKASLLLLSYWEECKLRLLLLSTSNE